MASDLIIWSKMVIIHSAPINYVASHRQRKDACKGWSSTEIISKDYGKPFGPDDPGSVV